jgi:2-(1,2-epoxy-1,2-dihydrophenyl)acetyl-CoA isomerase
MSVIKYTVHDGICELLLCRPKKLNAMGPQFFQELDEAVTRASNDDEVRCILILAEGKAFTAGLDLMAG